ncbi:unnamed protein product [Amoebophrya sp. A25]|nr:unnamed protein product [Amoebophrya sp. A25]|eukprot:GSA25T00007496001.1
MTSSTSRASASSSSSLLPLAVATTAVAGAAACVFYDVGGARGIWRSLFKKKRRTRRGGRRSRDGKGPPGGSGTSSEEDDSSSEEDEVVEFEAGRGGNKNYRHNVATGAGVPTIGGVNTSQEGGEGATETDALADATYVPDNANADCVGVDSEQAGKAAGCAGCPNQGACASGEAKKVDPAVAQVAEVLKDVRRKVLVLSGKGGVGKSTVSCQLSFAFSRTRKVSESSLMEVGRLRVASNLEKDHVQPMNEEEAGDEDNNQVGLLDIDICGPSLPTMLGLRGHEVHQSSAGWSPVYLNENLCVMSIGFMLPKEDDAIIWRGPRKNGLIRQFLTDVTWGAQDYLFVDTPPGTSDEHLAIVGYLADAKISGAIIVTSPQEVALADVRKEVNFCKKTGVPVLGVIENMSGFLGVTSEGVKKMCADYGLSYLGAIPLDREVGLAGERGTRITSPGLEETMSHLVEGIEKRLDEVEGQQAAQ